MSKKLGDVICWWSGGITSAVACKTGIDVYGIERCRIIMIDTENEDEDTYRFKTDCEKWYGKEIEIISAIGEKYESIQSVWRKHLSLNVATGAICSTVLKRKCREDWQKTAEYDYQVFGFEFEKKEFNRAMGMKLNHPKAKAIYPLLMYGYDKKQCINIVQEAGIEVPRMYTLGFENNNPCTLDTEIITFDGVKKIGEVIGTTQVLLNRKGWVFADIAHMGNQPIVKLTVKRQGLPNQELRFTPDHKWWGVRRKGKEKTVFETKYLQLGDILPMNTIQDSKFSLDKDYFLRGAVIGDGSLSGTKSSTVRLFGDKIQMMKDLGYNVTTSKVMSFISNLPLEYKTELPEISAMNYNERFSLLSGLYAMDGCTNIAGQSCLSTSDNLDYFILLLKSVGIIPTSIVDNTNHGSNHNKNGVLIKASKPNYIINFRAPLELLFKPSHIANYRVKTNKLAGWEVIGIETESNQEVACATVINSDPEFTLASGILTGNCFKTGCVQGGIGYWQKMQREFPEKFLAMADIEHELTNETGEPRTMLKDQSKKAKESGDTLVFLVKHPDYPNLKSIDEMPACKVEPLFDCNGLCGINDLERNATESEINFAPEPEPKKKGYQFSILD